MLFQVLVQVSGNPELLGLPEITELTHSTNTQHRQQWWQIIVTGPSAGTGVCKTESRKPAAESMQRAMLHAELHEVCRCRMAPCNAIMASQYIPTTCAAAVN